MSESFQLFLAVKLELITNLQIQEVKMTHGEIPREQWNTFFDDFSKKHEGWIVNWEVLGQDIGDQEKTDSIAAGRHQRRSKRPPTANRHHGRR